MPGETGAPAKLKYASATDEVKLFPTETNQPQMEEINTFLKEHTLTLKSHAAATTLASGELAKITKANETYTLPSAATASQIIGVFASLGPVTITTSGGATIYGDFISAEAIIHLQANQHVLLVSDGTNWVITAGEPQREQTYSALTGATSGEEVEPSATRPANVIGYVKGENGKESIGKIVIDGVTGPEIVIEAGPGNGPQIPFSFLAMPGQKWKITLIHATAKYQTILL